MTGSGKNIHVVRHGQSMHNAQVFRADGAGYNDARYIDAELTDLGEQQASALQTTMERLAPQLIVLSPMTRAIRTGLLATETIRPRTPVVVSALCTERLYSSGDIGSSTAHLARRFPSIDFSAVQPLDTWCDRSGTAARSLRDVIDLLSGSLQEHGTVSETDHMIAGRVDEFKRWLRAREETNIVVFSLFGFLTEFLDDYSTLKNAGSSQDNAMK